MRFMKLRNFILILTLTSVTPRLAFGQWTWLQPTPQGNTLLSSTVVGNTAYFLGESSTLLITSDGGTSWKINSPFYYPKDIASYGDNSVQRLTFADASRGWISRGIGGLFYTTDAGQTWTRKMIFFEHPGAVYFSGPHIGLTTGDYYRTTDGGNTWGRSTLQGQDNGGFTAFASTDETHIWAVSAGFGDNSGGGGIIKYSTDGGATWTYQNSDLGSSGDTSYHLLAIHMNPSGVGVTAGFAYSNQAGRTYGLILRTTNFGQTWSRAFDLTRVTTVLSVTDSLWILVGKTSYQPSILRSIDSGKTWSEVWNLSSNAPAPRTGVWIPSQKVLIAAGFNGAMYRSTDMGETWHAIGSSQPSLHDIAFSYVQGANTSYGYAVGDWSTLLRSTDRGQTWTRSSIDSVTPYYLLTVKPKENVVWAGGAARTLHRSTDYGVSWQRIPTPLDSYEFGGYVINDVDVYDSLHAVATTTLPNYYDIVTHLIYTSDGGRRWNLFRTPRGIMVNSVTLPRAEQIVMAGAKWSVFTNQSGFIWSSTDAGATWDSTALPQSVTNLVMFNCQEGLALTYRKLYRTGDGGKNWCPANLTWTTGYPTWWSLGGLTIPSEKNNIALAYLSGGAPNTGVTGGFVISTDRGVNWTQSTIELPNQDYTESTASCDGLANIFVSTENGGFVTKTSPTTVLYDPSPCSAQPLGTFAVDVNSLPIGGGMVTLNWSSFDADSAWIDNGIGAVQSNGLYSVRVYSSTTFTITFKNKWGTARYSISVHVVPPSEYALSQNYPNPFNASTRFTFSIPVKTSVSIRIYNTIGQEIITLAEGEYNEGMYPITWDAAQCPGGVYFYRLNAGPYVQTKKMILMK